MYKKILITLILFSSRYIFAIPTIAIPNLVYETTETTPITHSTISKSQESSINKTTDTTITTVLSKQVTKDLPMFNAAIRGAIISSKQFKVVNLPKNSSTWTNNTQTILDFVEKYNKIHNNKANNLETLGKREESKISNLKEVKDFKQKLPDYILFGQLVSINANENFSQIKHTDKTTKQFNIDIAVEYTLINTKDDSIMASFTGHGQSSDVKILSDSSQSDKQKPNTSLLLKMAAKDLANDVTEQLKEQFAISRTTYDNESKIITDVKVYN